MLCREGLKNERLFDIIKELSHIDSVTGSEQKFAEKNQGNDNSRHTPFEDRLGNLVYSRGRDNSSSCGSHGRARNHCNVDKIKRKNKV